VRKCLSCCAAATVELAYGDGGCLGEITGWRRMRPNKHVAQHKPSFIQARLVNHMHLQDHHDVGSMHLARRSHGVPTDLLKNFATAGPP
jgi:hypothetical protein